MQAQMNLKIKFRESFRPFAPVVLREDVRHYFDHQGDSPYMLMVAASIDGESKILDADPIKRAHPNFVPNIDSLGVNVEWEK